MKVKDGEIKEGSSKISKEEESLFLYGIPGRDKKGHSEFVQARVRPIQIDQIEKVKNKSPKGLFKSNSALFRSIMALGTFRALQILEEMGEDVDELKVNLFRMNLLAVEDKTADLLKDAETIQAARVKSGDMDNVVALQTIKAKVTKLGDNAKTNLTEKIKESTK